MPETIGEQLRLAREERGVPLREVADQTRISIHYLEAIEANEFKRLPGGIFNRSFLKAYARYVKFDEKEALEGYTRYMRAQGDTGEDVASAPYHSKVYTDTPATRSPALTVVLTIVILTLLTVGALALLKWYQRPTGQLRQVDDSQTATATSAAGVTSIGAVALSPDEPNVHRHQTNLKSGLQRSAMISAMTQPIQQYFVRMERNSI
jgi:cytoskeletal protein RodZ